MSSEENKKCTGCKFEGSIKEYFTSKYNKESKTCNKCRERSLRSRVKNREKRLENCKKWRDQNKERISLYNKHYREDEEKTWEELKKEKEIKDNVIGQPSKHRKLHYEVDNVIGKKCSKGEWQPLYNYNYDKNHWDKLRTKLIKQ